MTQMYKESTKTQFSGPNPIFDSFLPKREYLKTGYITHNYKWVPNTMLKKLILISRKLPGSQKMEGQIEGQMERQMNRQIQIHRTFLVTAKCPMKWNLIKFS